MHNDCYAWNKVVEHILMKRNDLNTYLQLHHMNTGICAKSGMLHCSKGKI